MKDVLGTDLLKPFVHLNTVQENRQRTANAVLREQIMAKSRRAKEKLLRLVSASCFRTMLARHPGSDHGSNTTPVLAAAFENFSHGQDNKAHPLPLRMQMRHRSPPLPLILEFIHRRFRRRTLTAHILLNETQTVPPAIKTMFSPQQLDKFFKVEIIDQRAGVASWVGGALAVGVMLFAGEGVVEGDVAGRADDAGVAGFAGDEERF